MADDFTGRELVDRGQRVIGWSSMGATSAVAVKLGIRHWGERVQPVRIKLNGEHPDNDRFQADLERWYGMKIKVLQAEKYQDHWGVIEGERYINGPSGAKCSALLKRAVREKFQDFDDIQIFGFDCDEERKQARAADFRKHHPEIMVCTPLLGEGLGKADCLAILDRAGIELPYMYRAGYNNNNCIGCVKGGMGYWNKIRRDFPQAFDRMAAIERRLGRSCIKGVPLDQLDPARGRIEDEPEISCGITCFQAEAWIEESEACAEV